MPWVERGGEHERLERRAGLARALGGQVELGDRARRRRSRGRPPWPARSPWPASIDDERGVRAGSGRGGSPLTAASAWACSGEVDGGLDAQPAAEEEVAALLGRVAEARVVEDPLLHLLDEVRRRVALGGGHHGGGRACSGVVVGHRCSSASAMHVVGEHPVEHELRGARGPASGSSNGSVAPGRWISPAISAASASVRSATGLPKYWWAAASIAVGAVPEVDGVQVELEDAVLGVVALELDRQRRLLRPCARPSASRPRGSPASRTAA